MDISYTALKNFLDCPQRYALRYQFRIPDGQSDWIILGKMLHSVIEAYKDLGSVAFKVYKDDLMEWRNQVSVKKLTDEQFLEQANRSLDTLQKVLQEFDLNGVNLEQEFVMQYKEGYNLVGRVDYLSPNLLMDWKFKKDFRFLDALQLSMYKKIANYKGEAGFFVVTWSGDSKLIKVNTSKTDKLLDEVIDKLISAIENNDFPANTKACALCPYRDVCKANEVDYDFYIE
jgi:CRISPR/Cas system-associated exonuclease Cas4 (RecB family)